MRRATITIAISCRLTIVSDTWIFFTLETFSSWWDENFFPSCSGDKGKSGKRLNLDTAWKGISNIINIPWSSFEKFFLPQHCCHRRRSPVVPGTLAMSLRNLRKKLSVSLSSLWSLSADSRPRTTALHCIPLSRVRLHSANSSTNFTTTADIQLWYPIFTVSSTRYENGMKGGKEEKQCEKFITCIAEQKIEKNHNNGRAR